MYAASNGLNTDYYNGTALNCVLLISCMQEGEPTDDWDNDIEGKPEGARSKIVRGAIKMAAKVSKSVAKDSGLLDEKYVNVVERAADVAEQQADADPNASLKDRAKIGG